MSALAALPAPAQLKSHLNVCLNVGFTPADLAEFADLVKDATSEETGQLAARTVDEVVKARK